MKKRIKKIQPGFLDNPLDSTIVVVCPNYDSFHPDIRFVRYIIFDRGIIVDEPSRAECSAIFDAFKVPLKVIHGPCIHCTMKGVRGPMGINLPPDFPPDPFETDLPYDDGYPKGDPDGSDEDE